MKSTQKIVLAIAMLMLGLLSSCAKVIDTPASNNDLDRETVLRTLGCNNKCAYVDSIDLEDGYVNNMYVYSTLPKGIYNTDPIKFGYHTAYTYKAILSFDTSEIPDNAVITDVALAIGYQRVGGTYDMAYLNSNMQFEIAYTYGFGGTAVLPNYALTGIDYSNAAAKSYMKSEVTIDAGVGFHHFPASSYSYINKSGKTQIRISFKTNPSLYAMNLYGTWSGIPGNKPQIYVSWQ